MKKCEYYSFFNAFTPSCLIIYDKNKGILKYKIVNIGNGVAKYCKYCGNEAIVKNDPNNNMFGKG